MNRGSNLGRIWLCCEPQQINESWDSGDPWDSQQLSRNWPTACGAIRVHWRDQTQLLSIKSENLFMRYALPAVGMIVVLVHVAGLTPFAAGPRWGNYLFTLEPTNLGAAFQADRPAMAVLQPYTVGVPEPSSWALLAMGAGALLVLRRRKSTASRSNNVTAGVF